MRTSGQWTASDCRAFQEAAGLTNERLAQRLNVSVRAVAYWRKHRSGILPALAQRVLANALHDAPDPVRNRFEEIVGTRRAARTGNLESVITDAADEAQSDPYLLRTGFDPESVACLWEETRAIARGGNRLAADSFTAARRVRVDALDLTERTRRPGDLADLYAIIGQATALMASTAFDLNHWDASRTLAQSAVSYASLAGHDSLHAWTLGLAALIANWRDDPDEALRHLQHGLQIAPAGIPRFRLRHIAARSYALLGDAAEVKNALSQAQHDQQAAEQHNDALSEETGGEFEFGIARAQACAAAAWLDLGRGPEAEDSAQHALDELLAQPLRRRPFSQVSGARIDLASARLLRKDFDGAQDVIHDVLELPPSMRNVSLSGRLVRVRGALASDQWSGDAQARRLSQAISVWLSEGPPMLSA